MVSHDGRKRTELDADVKSPLEQSFASGAQIREVFRAKQYPASLEVLKALRNQITVKSSEQSVVVNDARLNIVREWLEAVPGAEDVFGVLEKGPQPAVTAVCLSILSSLVSITSYHVVHHPLGHPIVKRLLTPQWLRKLDGYVSSSNPDVCLAAMKLLNATSNFAGGKEQKELLESFSWDVKVFHKLLYMRRKGKDTSGMLAKPDIRTLAIQYILSFLSASSSMKTMFIEQHRDVVLSIFKGLGSDSYSVIRHVLEILWVNLWQDQKVKRTLKVGIFGETTLQHLLKIYERAEQEGRDVEHVPADVVHHFLLAICTHRGIGICFADNGWYPRKDSDSDSGGKGGKIYNKILANVLKMLKVNEDARQQELALKILNACPELVAGYLPSSGLTMEPRLSSKWLANMAFVGSVVSLPIPVESFYLPAGIAGSSSASAQCAYQPTPPPLVIIIENIMPSLNLRAYISKALQSNSALVQQVAGLTLAQCLRKCEEVFDRFLLVERALEEDEAEGQWSRRRIEIEREIRKRVPEFQVIVAFSNAHRADGTPRDGPARLRSALLSELGQRLLWLYHRCAPSLVAEARYDAGKSLQRFVETDQEGSIEIEGVDGLGRLQQLHVLRMLRESDQFVWNAKAAPSSPSNINILLNLYLRSNHMDIRTALTSLLSTALKESLLFQHDPEELHLWLDALPSSLRSSDAESPDEARLTDEGTGVITFLDECMQRFAKTPHRYFEEFEALVKSFESPEHILPGSRLTDASPLLMTVLEQLSAKIRNNLLSPSDIMALITYLRKVFVGLLGKQSDLVLLRAVVERIEAVVSAEEVLPQHPVISNAVRKEMGILNACLGRCDREPPAQEAETLVASNMIEIFISQGESLEIKTGDSAKIHASELVDWLRLVDQPLDTPSIIRLARTVDRLSPRALSSLCMYLNPQSDYLWSLLSMKWSEPIEQNVPVDWLLLHVPSNHSQEHVSLLDRSLRQRNISLYDYKRLCGLVLHRLDPQSDLTLAGHNLELLALLLESAKLRLSSDDFSSLKVFIFVERHNLRNLSCVDSLPVGTDSTLQRLAHSVLTDREADYALVSSITTHWLSILRAASVNEEWKHVTGSLTWIRYMHHEDLLELTEKALQYLRSRSDDDFLLDAEFSDLMEELLLSLVRSDSQPVKSWLIEHLAILIGLLPRMPASAALKSIICRCVDAGMPLGIGGLPASDNHGALRSVIAEARSHWQSRVYTLPPEISVDVLLETNSCSKDTVSAVASLMYRSPDLRKQFWTWLASADISQRPVLEALVPALYAYFDSRENDEILAEEGLLVRLFESISSLVFEAEELAYSKDYLVECIAQLLNQCPTQRIKFVSLLEDQVLGLSVNALCIEAVRLVFAIQKMQEVSAENFIEATVIHALQWAVRYLSDLPDDSQVDGVTLRSLMKLISSQKNIAPHYAEPVISACIRYHLKDAGAIRLAEELLFEVTLKPLNVNRHVQSVLQHAQFESLAEAGSASKSKDAVISMLHTLFHLHPNNTCQPSHIQPLIRLYGGSLSTADCQLLAIFRLFEEHRKMSTASIFEQWSSTGIASQGGLDVATNLDSNRVFRTCLNFPIERDFMPYSRGKLDYRDAGQEMYDPLFVLLLFSQVLAVEPPTTALSWVSLYRTNIVSLVIRCLSSADTEIRQLALLQLGLLYNFALTSNMQERDHVIHILDLLRDQLPAESLDSVPIRLTSYMTLLLAHALRGIFYPSNFIYPITARFLLQRPELDMKDVPLLYSLLYSSSDDWKKERGWMIRFLADGMQTSEDWQLLKRRHTWDLLASVFQGSYNDRSVRHGILEVLANLTSERQAATSLIIKSALIQWMEMQLASVKTDESVAWAKIIENIIVIVDAEKLESASKGEWRRGLLRCLACLLRVADLKLLRIVTRCMMHLLKEGPQYSLLPDEAVSQCLERLETFEKTAAIQFSPLRGQRSADDSADILPPYRSHGLHQLPFEADLVTWGSVVEHLWRVSMTCGSRADSWDELTPRLILWRSVCGAEMSPIGEWARRQSISMLQEGTGR